jgi:mannosyltransferase
MDMRQKNWHIYGIVLLAMALRVYQLVDHSLWFDETLSWWVATTDIPGFLLPYGAYTPLYYFLIGAVSFLGKSEFLLRFASVFFGVLSVVMIERVGRRVGGERVGLLAALLLAINPFATWFAQDARMYAMVPFFVLMAMDGFMRATEGRGWRRMIGGSAGAHIIDTVGLVSPQAIPFLLKQPDWNE